MSFVAVGVGVAGVAGAAISAGAAGSAADEQANAARNAQNISEGEFNTINAQESPFLQSGTGSLGQLNYLMGVGTPGTLGGTNTPPTAASSTGGAYGSLLQPFNTSNFQQLSPAYNFQQQQGMQGVLNSDAAGQGSMSGSALKDLTNYNQGLANTSFNNAFNQYQTQQGNIFSRLSGIANLGQSAASQQAQSGTALAGQAAQSATNIGTAQAGGTVGAANAISGGLSSAALPWLMNGGGSGSAYTNDPGIAYGANQSAGDAANFFADQPVD
jgi:hypothetical protein